MGLYSSYSNNTVVNYESVNLDTVEAPVIDNFAEAGIMFAVETEKNYNALMEAVGISELNYFEENGKEMVYTEGTLSGFFAKAKEFFKKIIAKVAQITKAFFAKIDSFTKSDKEFLNKYRKDLNKGSYKDMKFKGYKFTNLDWAPVTDMGIAAMVKDATGNIDSWADAAETKCDEFIKDCEGNYEDRIEGAREFVLTGKSGSGFTGNEFQKEIFEYFRDGESSKEELDADIPAMMTILANSSDAKKNAEKTFRAIEKQANKDIRALEKAERDLENVKETSELHSKRIRCSNYEIRLHKDILNIDSIVNSGLLQALKDQSRQAKAVCVKALTYKEKNESVEYGTTGGFLENVRFN